jgi:hypothetical protein
VSSGLPCVLIKAEMLAGFTRGGKAMVSVSLPSHAAWHFQSNTQGPALTQGWVCLPRVKTDPQGMPEKGINALDAAVAAYTNIALLRQQVPSSHKIFNTIKGSEGWTANGEFPSPARISHFQFPPPRSHSSRGSHCERLDVHGRYANSHSPGSDIPHRAGAQLPSCGSVGDRMPIRDP